MPDGSCRAYHRLSCFRENLADPVIPIGTMRRAGSAAGRRLGGTPGRGRRAGGRWRSWPRSVCPRLPEPRVLRSCPRAGALAFFVGGDPAGSGGAGMHVENPGAPTEPPPDAPAVYERGGEIFPITRILRRRARFRAGRSTPRPRRSLPRGRARMTKATNGANAASRRWTAISGGGNISFPQAMPGKKSPWRCRPSGGTPRSSSPNISRRRTAICRRGSSSIAAGRRPHGRRWRSFGRQHRVGASAAARRSRPRN